VTHVKELLALMDAFPRVITTDNHELVIRRDRAGGAVAPDKIHHLVRVSVELNNTFGRVRSHSGASQVHFAGSKRK
jgi:hypothetical protein